MIGRMLPALALAALLLASSMVGAPSEAATPAEQARVIELVNAARTQQGLAPLAQNGTLTAAAESYAANMAALSFFSHTGLDGSTMVSRANAAGYTGWTFLGENIAAGQTSADAVFQAWMNSPGHRANILDARANEIGIGHAYATSSTYQHYWAMELGARPGVVPPTPAPSSATPTSIPTAPPQPTTIPTATPQPTAIPTATGQPAPAVPVPEAGRYRIAVPRVAR